MPGKSRYSSRSGMTLAELLTAFGVFSLFLLMLFSLYVFGLRSWKKADVEFQNYREAAMTVDALSREMLHTNRHSVRILYYTGLAPVSADIANPPTAPYCAVSFLTPFDTAGKLKVEADTGKPLWQAYLVYYVNPEDKTMRKKRIELPLPAPPGPPPPAPPGPPQSPTDPNPMPEGFLETCLDGEGKIMASGVTNFTFLDMDTNPAESTRTSSNPVWISLEVQNVSTTEEKPETVKLRRFINLMN